MQMLARRSDEGRLSGLGWIDDEVKRFDVSQFPNETHLPHMGWNDVRPRDSSDLFRDLAEESRFYFLHSYYFAPASPDYVLAETDYYGRFTSSVRSQHVFGVQFHPKRVPGGVSSSCRTSPSSSCDIQQYWPRAGKVYYYLYRRPGEPTSLLFTHIRDGEAYASAAATRAVLGSVLPNKG